MFVGNIFGAIAALGSAFVGVPQMVRCVRVGTRGVSATTFQIFTAADATWFAYSITHGLWLAALGNLTCVFTGTVVLVCLVRDGSRLSNVSKIFGLIVLLSALVAAVNLSFLVIWGGLLSFALRVPQARKIFSSHDISDVSIQTWLIAGGENVLAVPYGLLLNRPLFAFVCSTISLFSFVLVGGIVYRRRVARDENVADAISMENQAA
jgi:uncharacterized protein with PQ loop repeat